MMEPAPKPGSARFRAYSQNSDVESKPAFDIQQSFPTVAEARSAYPPGRRCRVMEVTERGRQPVA